LRANQDRFDRSNLAVMGRGVGAYERTEDVLAQALAVGGSDAPVVSSAAALMEGARVLCAKRIAVAAPYMRPLTSMVVDYLESAGLNMTDSAR